MVFAIVYLTLFVVMCGALAAPPHNAPAWIMLPLFISGVVLSIQVLT